MRIFSLLRTATQQHVTATLLGFAQGLTLATAFPLSVYAKPVMEKSESFVIDWGNLKIRFVGEAPREGEEEVYADTEKKAWNQGLRVIHDEVVNFHRQQLLQLQVDKVIAEQSALAAGARVASGTYSYKTEYFTDGRVRVHLESHLAKALQRQDVIFTQKELPRLEESQFSGLVLRCSKWIQPRASYTLVDETGMVLFQVNQVAREAYEKNLMGQWYIDPSRAELTRAVGSKPVSLPLSQDEQGRLVVEGFAWKEALRDSKAVLAHARIAIVLPSGGEGSLEPQSEG